MVEKRLLDYLKTYMDQGYSKQDLRIHLQKVGWQASVLEEAFKELEPAKPAVQKPVEKPVEKIPEREPHLERIVRKERSNIIPIVMIISVFVIIGLFFYVFAAVVSPNLGEGGFGKPSRPIVGAATEAGQINPDHVEYVVNRMGLEELHSNPIPK